MLIEIKTYTKSEWEAVAYDLDNGSAYISFYSDDEKFAEVFCDDYDHGNTKLWHDLDKSVEELPDSLTQAKKELEYWDNGMGSCNSPLDSNEWTEE